MKWSQLLPQPGEGILPPKKTETSLELFAFTQAYLDRLRKGDPPTEQHFVSYFGELLRIKLRARFLASDTVDELRQETFIRVITAIRTEGSIHQPERLGAFVNSTCDNVLREFYRSLLRSQPLEESHVSKSGKILDLEDLLVTRQAQEHIHRRNF